MRLLMIWLPIRLSNRLSNLTYNVEKYMEKLKYNAIKEVLNGFF